MAFKPVASLNADVAISLGKADKKTGKVIKQVEGYYLGARKQDTKLGVSTSHFLQTSAGNVLVWGTTDLNRKISSVSPGTMVRITATGTTPTPKGPMRTFNVEEDVENTIEVASLDDGGSTAYADEDEDSTSSNNDEADESNTLSAAASRKAQVDAILAARKNKSK